MIEVVLHIPHLRLQRSYSWGLLSCSSCWKIDQFFVSSRPLAYWIRLVHTLESGGLFIQSLSIQMLISSPNIHTQKQAESHLLTHLPLAGLLTPSGGKMALASTEGREICILVSRLQCLILDF